MADFALVVQTIFDGVWDLYSISVPGFDFSFGDVFLASMLAPIGLAVLNFFLHRDSASSAGRSTRNPKISKERQGDVK